MSRRRTLDLTDQQQRVLELMAHGRTNYDIAQDLDVTLDGAKYHIRQVFDKLGVDSREEAVAAWKAARGSVFERVRGWLWPVGAVAAGGVVVVAAVVVGAIAWSAVVGGGSERLPGGIWVAQIVPNDPSNPAGLGTLKVFNAEDPTSSHVLPGSYIVGNGSPTEIEWSPDGRHLAVRTPQAPGLVVFSRDNKGWAGPVSFEGRQFFSWSPDSKMLGVLGLRSSLVDSSGRVVSQFDVPLTGGDNSSNVNGPLVWAPDNADTFAAGASNHLIVLGPSGGHAYRPPMTGEWVVTAAGWQDEQTVLVTATSAPAPTTVKSFAVTLNGDTATWAERTNATVSAGAKLPPPDAAVVALWTDPANEVVAIGRTRDGSGVVYGPAFGYPLDPNASLDYHIVVQADNGRVYSADLGTLSIGGANGPSRAYDVVVTK